MWLPADIEQLPDRDVKEKTKMGESNLKSHQPIFLNPLILVIEPDEDTRLMMKYLLQMWKYSVIESANADEALEMTEIQQPEAVLFCDKLQSEDYATTIRQIRELLPFGKTLIVFISAYSESAVRASVLAAGADNFLVKPIDFGHLEKLLQCGFKQKYEARGIFL